MTRYTVQPVPDRERTGNKQWQVLKNGRRVSTHRLKSAAERERDRLADRGDSKQSARSDGTYQTESTHRVFGPGGDQGG